MMNECNLYLINKHAPQCFKSAHSAALRLSASAGFDIESKRVATADLGNFNWICIRNRHTHTYNSFTHSRTHLAVSSTFLRPGQRLWAAHKFIFNLLMYA